MRPRICVELEEVHEGVRKDSEWPTPFPAQTMFSHTLRSDSTQLFFFCVDRGRGRGSWLSDTDGWDGRLGLGRHAG